MGAHTSLSHGTECGRVGAVTYKSIASILAHKLDQRSGQPENAAVSGDAPGGRLHIGILNGIKLESRPASDWNAWLAASESAAGREMALTMSANHRNPCQRPIDRREKSRRMIDTYNNVGRSLFRVRTGKPRGAVARAGPATLSLAFLELNAPMSPQAQLSLFYAQKVACGASYFQLRSDRMLRL